MKKIDELKLEISQLENTKRFKRRHDEINKRIELLFSEIEKLNNDTPIEIKRPEIVEIVDENKIDEQIDLTFNEIKDIIKPEKRAKKKDKNI